MLKKPVFPKDFLDEDIITEIGHWSIYGLASDALQHYFPDEYECGMIDGEPDGEWSCKGGTRREVELVKLLGLEYWHEIVQKYQREVGYNAPHGFDPLFVNEH